MTHIETETGGLFSIEPQEINDRTWVRFSISHPIGNGSVFLNPAEVEQVLAALSAAQQQPAGSDRMRAERLWQAISNALYDYDHGDELSAIDRLRSALAAEARPREPV